ncbi:MAG: aspartate aminotransferase family protein [Pseudomonadota bacterium]
MNASNNRSGAQWQALDSAHHMHPFTDHKELSEKRARIITKADGVYIYDADGNKTLDGMSGLWCVNIGYGQTELIEAATAQMHELPYYNSFFQCTNTPAIELAALLQEISPPQFNKVFFTGSGSEANDTIVRMVRTYWQVMGQPERKVIISRENAYHGSTVAAASLGGMKSMHEQGDLPIPGIEHVKQPYWFGSDQSMTPDEFGLIAAKSIEDKILELGADKVAAFIGEPIQGAGGVIVPPDSYWPEVQRICDKYGVLLISDEVICGFGRLGEWFGAQHFGTTPDFIPFAKGVTSGYLPLGGVFVSDRVAEVIIDKAGEFAHGFTYSGHPTACAVAIANVKLIQREGLVERIKTDIGPYLQERWLKLTDHPLVAEARMVGLMGAIELVKSKDPLERFDADLGVGSICRDMSIESGLVMRAVGTSMITAPPFTLSHAEADELVDKVHTALDKTMAQIQ